MNLNLYVLSTAGLGVQPANDDSLKFLNKDMIFLCSVLCFIKPMALMESFAHPCTSFFSTFGLFQKSVIACDRVPINIVCVAFLNTVLFNLI